MVILFQELWSSEMLPTREFPLIFRSITLIYTMLTSFRFEYDFYLCSHTAIQGTARPVHYHVILDEANVPVDEFQRMVYQMCYQYMRSTTPVSLFPAVYYAHLASNRARAHESAPASGGPRGGQKYEELQQDGAVARVTGRSVHSSQTGNTEMPLEAPPLLPLGGGDTAPELLDKIRTGMCKFSPPLFTYVKITLTTILGYI